MPTGNDCPTCGRNIGMLAVFKAPMPNRIYCPHCGERLRYGGTDGPIIAAGMLVAALIAAGGVVAFSLGFADLIRTIVVTVVFLLLGVLALEIVFVMLLWYGSYELEPVNRPKDDNWDDEDF